ncbi:hypothetical protein CP03DC29_0357A, partial [Chlamydia psittaci 03DC29]
MSNHRSHLFR